MKSLDVLLIRETNNYLLEHVGHGENFAANLREAYEAANPKGGPVKWSQSPQPSQRLNSDYVKFKRYLDRERAMPAALVVPWLSILPEDCRRRVLAELCEGFGQIVMRARKASGNVTDVAAFAALMKEAGEAFAAIAPLLEDGQITSEDGIKAIRHALLELSDLSTALETVRGLLVAALPAGDVIELKKRA